MKTVRIIVEGGVVQDIDVPEGVRVIVWDYDTEGVDASTLRRDRGGDTYVETTWENENDADIQN